MDNTIRVQLTLRPQDKPERKAAELLAIDSRKKSELVLIAVRELMEKYNLSCSSEDITTFVSSYPFLRAHNGQNK